MNASEDADWESMHPEEQDDEAYDCPKCGSGNTEIDEMENGGFSVYCNMCEAVTETHPGEAKPTEGFHWHGPELTKSEPEPTFSDEENQEFTAFMKSIGGSKKADEHADMEAYIQENQGDHVKGPEEYDRVMALPDAEKEQWLLSHGWAKENEWHGATWWLGRQMWYKVDDEETPMEELDEACHKQLEDQMDPEGSVLDPDQRPGIRAVSSEEDDELMERAEVTLQKQGVVAPAVAPTSTAVVSPNVVQNQNIARPQTAPGQPGSSVAIMPGQEEEQGGIRRHTVEPELPNANYHMQGSDEGLFGLLASEIVKLGGGTDFAARATGKTVEEAFRNARSDAQHERGHGGYTGTIAEKSDFAVIQPPAGWKPDAWANLIHSAYQLEENPQMTTSKKVQVKPGSKCPKCGKGKLEFKPNPQYKSVEPTCPNCGAKTWDLYSSTEGSGENQKFFTYKKVKVNLDPQETELLKRHYKTYDDKFGPAVAIQLKKNEWLFMGIASS